MKAIIRWQGLIVFCFFIALICLFTFFFANGIIVTVVETMGSKIVGARVDLDGADLSFLPVGLELSGLQITNPDKPLRNIVEIDRLAMAIDPIQLLRRKIIIDEMVADGIRPDTPRKKSGAMPEYSARAKSAVPENNAKGFKMPEIKIPDAREVLAREELTTINLATEFQTQIKADREKWQQRLAELPNQEKLAQYKARLGKIKSGSGLAGLLGGATELLAVKEEIQTDLNRLNTAQQEFSQISTTYQNRLAIIQQAPRQDIKRLSDKYSLSANGLANLSPLLFGDKTGRMVEQTLSWYAKLKPLLERHKEPESDSEIIRPVRGKGVSVRFREEDPLPDFLIRNIAASIQVAAGSFAGTIKNVTPDQDVLGLPLSFTFGGESLQGLRSISFNGILDHITPDRSRDTMNIAIEGYSIAEGTTGAAENKPATITGGLLDLSAQVVLQQQAVNANIQANLKEANFSGSTDQPGDIASQAITAALSGVSNVSVKAVISGTMANYKIELSSDLDKILKQAVANTIKDQTAKFEQTLKDGVMAQVKDPLAAAGGSFSDFGNISQELKARLQAGSSLL